MEKLELFYTPGRNINSALATEDSMTVPQKKNNYYMIQQFYFWIYTLKTEKRDSKRDLCTMFIAWLFTTASRWEHPKCTLMEEQYTHTTMWYTQTCGIHPFIKEGNSDMQFYNTMNSTQCNSTTQMNLKDNMLSEISQSQGDKYS